MTVTPIPTAADLTLDELAEETAKLLAKRGLLGAQEDRRVSAAPDARTVRYYTTLGLLDPPVIRGRQARYGRRQVLQLAAIKALQATRLSLGEIQARLYGRSEAELVALLEAAVPGKRAPRQRSLTWREVTVEPGLKVMAEESWTPGAPRETLVERLRRALELLQRGE